MNDDRLHVATTRNSPNHQAPYAVHRIGTAPVPFYYLKAAKDCVAEIIGKPVKWERREVPDGRGRRLEWWPS